MPGIAERDDAIVVAMDYNGTVDLEGPTGTSSRGWRVSKGATDSIAATQLFTSTCQNLNPTRFANTAFGVSMGGNMTGLAPSEYGYRDLPGVGLCCVRHTIVDWLDQLTIDSSPLNRAVVRPRSLGRDRASKPAPKEAHPR